MPVRNFCYHTRMKSENQHSADDELVAAHQPHQPKSQAEKSPRFKKWQIVTAAVMLVVLLAGAMVLFAKHHGANRQNEQSTAATPVASKPSVALSAKPGTFVAISTEPAGIATIGGLETCVQTTLADKTTGCQLHDDNTTITLTAPPTATQNGKAYTFVEWKGCSRYDDNKFACHITLIKGANVAAQAVYAVKQDPPRPGSRYVELIINHKSSVDYPELPAYITDDMKPATVSMELIAHNLKLENCTIVDHAKLDDYVTERIDTYKPLAKQDIYLTDGMHDVVATCHDGDDSFSAHMFGTLRDNLPKQCTGFSFTDSAATATTLDSLKSGIVGRWEGCMTAPWMPPFYVSFVFNADGSYTAAGNEILDGTPGYPLYYGGQQNGPKSVYDLTSIAAGLGDGTISIDFGGGTVIKEDLHSVKLMGDKLSFNFSHFNTYGPLQYQLYRK